jgi:hypothetical protein
VIVRPFNISGPRQFGVGGFALPRFVGHAMLNRPLTVFSGGTQVRAFTHVIDICSDMPPQPIFKQEGSRGSDGMAAKLESAEFRGCCSVAAPAHVSLPGGSSFWDCCDSDHPAGHNRPHRYKNRGDPLRLNRQTAHQRSPRRES